VSSREAILYGREYFTLKRAICCITEKLHASLREDGAVKALLGIVQSGNSDVIAQVARGIANFAKCESRGIIQGMQSYILICLQLESFVFSKHVILFHSRT